MNVKIFFKYFLAIILLASQIYSQSSKPHTLSIPIFKNNTGNAKYDWISETLSDMLTTDIASTDKIRVVARVELKEILAEQKLGLSGLLDEDSQVKVGNLVGANILVYGSFTLSNGIIRIDTKIFDIEKGTIENANTIQGNMIELLSLEKKMALQTMKGLGLKLSDEDKFRLLQFQSENLSAIESNYKGVIALDEKNIKRAEQFFKQAMEYDPYYKKAALNFKAAQSIQISGMSLFADVSMDLKLKKRQRELLQVISANFLENYWIIELAGQPRPVTKFGNTKDVTIEIPLEIKINIDAVKVFIADLEKIASGEGDFYIHTSHPYNGQKPQNIKLFDDNLIWLYSTYGIDKFGKEIESRFEHDVLFFNKEILVKIYSDANIITTTSLNVSVGSGRYRGSVALGGPSIWIKNEFSWFRQYSEIPANINVSIEGIVWNN